MKEIYVVWEKHQEERKVTCGEIRRWKYITFRGNFPCLYVYGSAFLLPHDSLQGTIRQHEQIFFFIGHMLLLTPNLLL